MYCKNFQHASCYHLTLKICIAPYVCGRDLDGIFLEGHERFLHVAHVLHNCRMLVCGFLSSSSMSAAVLRGRII